MPILHAHEHHILSSPQPVGVSNMYVYNLLPDLRIMCSRQTISVFFTLTKTTKAKLYWVLHVPVFQLKTIPAIHFDDECGVSYPTLHCQTGLHQDPWCTRVAPHCNNEDDENQTREQKSQTGSNLLMAVMSPPKKLYKFCNTCSTPAIEAVSYQTPANGCDGFCVCTNMPAATARPPGVFDRAATLSTCSRDCHVQ